MDKKKTLIALLTVTVVSGAGCLGLYYQYVEKQRETNRKSDDYYLDTLHSDLYKYEETGDKKYLELVEATKEKMHQDGYSYAEIGAMEHNMYKTAKKNFEYAQDIIRKAEGAEARIEYWNNVIQEQEKEIKKNNLKATGETVVAEQPPADFIYSEAELQAIEKWKYETFEMMYEDALKGDPAALYNIGMSFLMGQLGPINIEEANRFFVQSASLGFAPALEKLRVMCLLDYENPFLSLVYANLVVAFGHSEYIMAYHQFRDNIATKCGKSFVQEIEKIASSKYNLILNNQDELKKASDSDKAKVCFCMTNVTDEDSFFDAEYWAKLFSTAKST